VRTQWFLIDGAKAVEQGSEEGLDGGGLFGGSVPVNKTCTGRQVGGREQRRKRQQHPFLQAAPPARAGPGRHNSATPINADRIEAPSTAIFAAAKSALVINPAKTVPFI